MKILYIIDWPINSIGGSQKSTYTLAVEMKKLGNNVNICCPISEIFESSQKDICLINHKFNGNSFKDKLHKIFFYKNIINQGMYDVVHVQNPTSFTLVGILLILHQLKPAKYIFTDRDFFDAYKKYQRLFFSIIYRKYNNIICTTKLNASKWKKIGTNAQVIPNVLDDKWYGYDINLKKKNTMIGFCGRYIPYKRWDTVFNICKMLKDSDFTFAFSFAIVQESEKQAIQDFIKKLLTILPNKCKFYTNLNQDDMMSFYEQLDYFVIASENESFGRTILEAMSRGCVTIGSNSGGIPEVIGNKNLLFNIGDYQEAVNIINRLENNMEEYKYYRSQLYDRVNKNFNKTNLVNQHDLIYKTNLKYQ